MEHYICLGGCGGVSDTPGVCQDANCPDHGKPLVPCDCGNKEQHHHHRTIDEGNNDEE